jgi:hypothetical protein
MFCFTVGMVSRCLESVHGVRDMVILAYMRSGMTSELKKAFLVKGYQASQFIGTTPGKERFGSGWLDVPPWNLRTRVCT